MPPRSTTSTGGGRDDVTTVTNATNVTNVTTVTNATDVTNVTIVTTNTSSGSKACERARECGGAAVSGTEDGDV